MSDDNEVYTAAQVREFLDGHADRDAEAYPHAFIEDERTRRLLTVLRQSWDPHDAANPSEVPATADELELYQKMLRAAATEDLAAAIRNGDVPRMKTHTGDTSERADISGMHALDQIRDIVTRTAGIFYEIGHMGHGKTDFAVLLAQQWKREHPDGEVGTNIKTLEEKDEFVPSFDAVKDWMEEPEEVVLAGEVTPKLLIIDEASSHLGGGGEQGYQARQLLGPLIFKIRKYGGSAIIVGHDGKNVTPIVRELATIIEKTGKKEAGFYESINNRDPQDEILRVEGIPPTDWRYNHREATDFEWQRGADKDTDTDADSDDKSDLWKAAVYTAIQLKESGATHREAAENIPYGKDWVGDRWKEYQRGELDDVIDSVEALTE